MRFSLSPAKPHHAVAIAIPRERPVNAVDFAASDKNTTQCLHLCFASAERHARDGSCGTGGGLRRTWAVEMDASGA
jgi:hypothetical protein